MARILVVDDELGIRTTLAEFIGEDGHETWVAEDAHAALAMVAERPFDVIITDILLPRMTGTVLLQELQKASPGTEVIMITAEPTVESASTAVRNGAFDYLSKPISRDAIRATVTRAVRAKENADERRRLQADNERYRARLEEEVARKTEALRRSEGKYRAIFENAAETVFVVSKGRILFANPSTEKLMGYSIEEITTSDQPFADFIHPEDVDAVLVRHAARLRGDAVPELSEFRVVRKGGAVRWIELRAIVIQWDDRPATLNFARDITERKLAAREESLRQERIRRSNEALLRIATDPRLHEGELAAALHLITETSARVLGVQRVVVWLIDGVDKELRCMDAYHTSDGRHTPGNDYRLADLPVYLEALERSRVLAVEDILADWRMQEFDLANVAEQGIVSVLDAAVRSEGRLVGDICFEQMGQRRRWTHEDEEFAGEIAALITLKLESMERRRIEHALAQSESQYRALFEDSPASLWHEDFSAVKTRLDELKGQGVEDLATYFAAHPESVDHLISLVRVVDANAASVALHRADSKDRLLDGLHSLITDVSRECLARQFVAIAAGAQSFEEQTIDRTFAGDPIHVAIRWSVPRAYRESLERVLVSKVDMTQVVRAERRLRSALDGTIEAIGLTTETRDPYTAGHQRRVTQLAVAIAREIGGESMLLDATRAAGLMHDIGKMAIPAEILSKPGSLTEMEMALIHSHPQVAYDILKTVAFPWPVAEIVLQHHERIDGSGYPLSLRGDQIRPEASILSVADVVEAMASHRPYRPAVGIDAALREIESGRGTRYDSLAVDACLSLFRERRFAFSET